MTSSLFSALFAAVVVLSGGRPQADIVIPEKPNAVERLAAEELAYHLGKMGGCTFKTISEDALASSSAKGHFFIGATKAAKAAGLDGVAMEMEAWRVRTAGDAVILVGCDVVRGSITDLWAKSSRGTLYAVYDFLFKSCGVRWLWPGESGEVVPKRRDLSVDEGDICGLMRIGMRLFYGMREKPLSDGFVGFRDATARTRYYADTAKFLLRQRLGTRRSIRGGHCFQQYWKRFGESHPEYFNRLPDGKRRPLNGDRSGASVTMCVSEPGLWRQIAEDAKDGMARTKATGGEIYVGICENDSPGMCTCPRCRAWDAPSDLFAQSDYWSCSGKDSLACGNRFWRLCDVRWGELGCDWTKPRPPDISDRYARFYNSVVAELRKIEPTARVVGYAYANYSEGPKNTKMSPGVTIEYVPRNFFPYVEADSRHLRREWDAWRAAGADEMLFRPNYTLSGANFPVDYGRYAVADLVYIASNGLAGCRFDSLMGSWGSQTALMYTLLRNLADPTLGYDAALDELCGAFGPAGRDVRRYFKFVADFSASVKYEDYVRIGWKNRCSKQYPAGGHNRFANIVHDLYPDSFFVEAAEMLSAAARAAKGDEDASRRVAFLRKGLEDARLTRVAVAKHVAWAADRTAEKRAAFDAAFRELLDYRASIEADDVANYDCFARAESAGLGWKFNYGK